MDSKHCCRVLTKLAGMTEMFHQFSSGSEAAFTAYYERYHRGVYASLKKMCDDEALAKDLTQEVFKDLWARRGEFKNEEHVGNSLFFMAKSFFLQHQRRKERTGKAVDELGRTTGPTEAEVQRTFLTEEVFVAVEQALLKLPPQQKMVMELLSYQDRDVRTVATQLQLAPQTIRNHRSQALQFLRTELYRRGFSLACLLALLLLCFHQA